MLFHHTQGFMQEAWFQALQLFQSHLRPDLYDDAAYFHENPHLNELVVLQALGRVHPNNEQFAREVLWLLYALEGDFLLDHPEEDHFPVTEWPVLRGSDQYGLAGSTERCDMKSHSERVDVERRKKQRPKEVFILVPTCDMLFRQLMGVKLT